MKPIDVCHAMIRWAVVLLLTCCFVAVLGPTVSATVSAVGSYAVRPHQISCKDFAIKVPMSWKISSADCNGLVSIERRSHMLFGSDRPGFVFIRPLLGPDQVESVAQSEKEFRNAYSGESYVPYQLNGTYKYCLRVPHEFGGDWTTVKCMEAARRVEVTYVGAESNLDNVAALIK